MKITKYTQLQLGDLIKISFLHDDEFYITEIDQAQIEIASFAWLPHRRMIIDTNTLFNSRTSVELVGFVIPKEKHKQSWWRRFLNACELIHHPFVCHRFSTAELRILQFKNS